MRKMILMKYCGIDWAEDRHEVEATFSVTLLGKDLDLCEEHANKIPIKLIVQTVQQYGTPSDVGAAPQRRKQAGRVLPPAARPEKKKRLNPNELACPLCDHVVKSGVGKPRNALGQHLLDKHPGVKVSHLVQQGLLEKMPTGKAAHKVAV